MGTPEPPRPAPSRRGGARAARALSRRAAPGRRSFAATTRALDELAAAGAQVSVRAVDLDRGAPVYRGDDHLSLPVGGLGIVPLLIEVAARVEDGRLHPYEIIDRAGLASVGVSGLWQHLRAPALPLVDVAALAAATGDALAANALLARVGLDAVRERIESLGMRGTALLDVFRDVRGPDDAPHLALGSARDFADLMAGLANAAVVSAAVSAQVAEWLTRGHDLSLTASAFGLDPFADGDERRPMLFLNKTGRADGVRAEAGVLTGPRAGLAYALIVCFDDLSPRHRLRAHEAFRTFGVEIMEFVH